MSDEVVKIVDSGKSEHRHWRVESRCELLPWLLSLPLGLSRKRAKDLLRFRAVHVQKQHRTRDASAVETRNTAFAEDARNAWRRDTVSRPEDARNTVDALESSNAPARRRDRPIGAGRITARHNTVLEPGDVVTIEFGAPANELAMRRGGTAIGRRALPVGSGGGTAIGRGALSVGGGAGMGRGGLKGLPLGLKIFHLDDAIVVIDKPAGLLSMGSEREKERTAHRILNDHLKEATKSREQQAFIVHRLDRETSGLMLFARNVSMQAALQQNWKAVIKRYLAVVEGVLAQPQGTLNDRLIESKSLRVHRVAQGGEIAITHYRVVEVGRERSLVELTLETGRKHQIRVQLAGVGNPVVGDQKYGARTDPARRLALHSYELRFCHPVSGASMEFSSALPSRLRQLLAPTRSGSST